MSFVRVLLCAPTAPARHVPAAPTSPPTHRRVRGTSRDRAPFLIGVRVVDAPGVISRARRARARMKQKRRPTSKPLFAPTSMRSMRRAREVTSAFHEVTRTLDDPRSTSEERAAARERAMRAGGVDALRDEYQRASALTTTRHRTAKFTFSVLTKLGRRPKRGERPLKTLEVGAINTDLMSAKFLDVRAIDVKSRHPKIEQIDFFKLPVEDETYDVVHSSMVLNCVPTAELRGEMLHRTSRLLRTGGSFFLMLPARCVNASARMTSDKLIRLCRACGLRVVEKKSTPKVMFYCFEKLAKRDRSELSSKELSGAEARSAFLRRERLRDTDARADNDHFGVVLGDEHDCGF